VKHHGERGGGRDGRRGHRGGGPAGRRGGGAGGTRAVWPPERRESAKEAIEQLLSERGLARRFEQTVESAARDAVEHLASTPPAGGQASSGIAVGGPKPSDTHLRPKPGDTHLWRESPFRPASPLRPARRDLRELPTFTIDPTSARDFDDAVSAERLNDGVTRVWVHIADVSAYVREGGQVDVEARERATSVYVPGAVEPMLPEALSNDACSLLPGQDRAAVTVELELHGAQVRRAAFYRSTIRSDERLDYERVDAIFAGRKRASAPWGEPLAAAKEAAAALGREREGHGGALTLASEEPEFTFDADGEVKEIVGRVQTESHRLIEHLMIAANEAVARELQRRKTPCLYRVHEPPAGASVERLVEQLASLGVATPAVADRISPARAGELVAEVSRLVDAHVRRAVARARDGDTAAAPGGGRQALTTLVLRALQQAYYSPRNLGHAGLGSACYCHFTSPIRRYPDLVCHRALLSTIGGPECAPKAQTLAELGDWTSQREREAMELERDGDDIARCFALERELLSEGWERAYPGEVVGLIDAGAFVAFGPTARKEPNGGYRYEGMLPVRRLAAAMARDGREGRLDGRGDAAPAPEGGAGLRRVREEFTGARPLRSSRPQGGGRGPGGAGRHGARHGAAASRGSGAQRGGPRAAAREWWELNEQGTILKGERSGMTLRLGDPIVVRVRRVDPRRGRVDLDLVPAEE
jgi:ribonuclease R